MAPFLTLRRRAYLVASAIARAEEARIHAANARHFANMICTAPRWFVRQASAADWRVLWSEAVGSQRAAADCAKTARDCRIELIGSPTP